FDEGLVLDKIIHNDPQHRRKKFAEHTLIGFANLAFISEVYPNVALSAAIFLCRWMRGNASMALDYCNLAVNFGCGSRIYSNTNIAKGNLGF
ncbi:MAG: hypothetical protein EBX06_04750, partial [Rhodobacteraceae bacterium]|nr:hypothetical protein [Paracoccaceae bacterium]